LRPPDHDIPGVVRRMRLPLVLAAGTTVTGFLVLASADLPGIREVGVFAMLGVGFAVVATLWLVPEIIPASLGPTPPPDAPIDWLQGVTAARASRRKLAWATAGIVLAVCALGLPRMRWDDDVFALNVALRPEWRSEDADVRALVSPQKIERLVVALGADDDSA